jgi:hypothetical protein
LDNEAAAIDLPDSFQLLNPDDVLYQESSDGTEVVGQFAIARSSVASLPDGRVLELAFGPADDVEFYNVGGGQIALVEPGQVRTQLGPSGLDFGVGDRFMFTLVPHDEQARSSVHTLGEVLDELNRRAVDAAAEELGLPSGDDYFVCDECGRRSQVWPASERYRDATDIPLFVEARPVLEQAKEPGFLIRPGNSSRTSRPTKRRSKHLPRWFGSGS